jgi:hypothetical protein
MGLIPPTLAIQHSLAFANMIYIAAPRSTREASLRSNECEGWEFQSIIFCLWGTVPRKEPVMAITVVIDRNELTELTRGYFTGELALDCIERAVSVDYARALYGVLTELREKCRKAGAHKIVQKLYMIQYRVLPSWFHYERKQSARSNQKPAPVAPAAQETTQPVKPPTKGGFERIKQQFLDACRKGQQARAGGFKGVIHQHYPQFEYAADQALAHYFPKEK